MKHIEKEWEDYKANVLPPNASQIQLDETRKAFFAGAASLFKLLNTQAGDGSNEPTAEDLKFMSLLHAELDAFLKQREIEAKDFINRQRMGRG